jgi:hypothetical protein
MALGKDDIFQEERDQLASFLCDLVLQQCTPVLKELDEAGVTTTSVVGTFADYEKLRNTVKALAQGIPDAWLPRFWAAQSDEFARGLSDTALKGAKTERAREVAEGIEHAADQLLADHPAFRDNVRLRGPRRVDRPVRAHSACRHF